MQLEPQTQAYLPFHSTQDWATDPEFICVTIDYALADLVVRGINTLKATGFDSITSGRFSMCWDPVTEHDDGAEFGYVPFEPEYTLHDPDVVIYSQLKFVFPFKHTGDQGWSSMRFDELAGYLDNAWCESLGYTFVQLPDREHSGDGTWLGIRASDMGTGFTATGETLFACVKVVADHLESAIRQFGPDQTIPPHLPRPRFDELRVLPDYLRQAA